MWIEGDDDQRRCSDDPGPVRSEERVARFLFQRAEQVDDLSSFFQRKDLCAPRTPFSNECGRSSGCSLQRRRPDDEVGLRLRAVRHAALRPGRKSEGAAIASVAALRAIRERGKDCQVVYVFDDSGPDNPLHCVLRLADHDPAAFDDLRLKIIEAFSVRLPP